MNLKSGSPVIKIEYTILTKLPRNPDEVSYGSKLNRRLNTYVGKLILLAKIATPWYELNVQKLYFYCVTSHILFRLIISMYCMYIIQTMFKN